MSWDPALSRPYIAISLFSSPDVRKCTAGGSVYSYFMSIEIKDPVAKFDQRHTVLLALHYIETLISHMLKIDAIFLD